MRFCAAGAKIFSTCSRRQYFAILLDPAGAVIGTGYNGVPSGFVHCDQGGCPRALTKPPPGSPYHDCYALHAESNAFLHSDYSIRCRGTTLYVNGPPCFDCAKLVVNAGVKRLVHIPDSSYADWPQVEAFLLKANIAIIPVMEADL